MTRRAVAVWLALAVWLGGMGSALAQDQAAAIEELKREMRELRQEVNKKQKKIEALENRLDAVQKTVNAIPGKEPVKAATAKTEPSTPQTALDQAVQAVQGPKAEKGKVETAKGEAALDQAVKAVQAPEGRPSLLSFKAGGATLRLVDVSFDVMTAGGTSTATDKQLQNGLQGGGHDPRKRGFTLQQAELSLAGAVDPYFNGEAHIVYFIDPATGESQVELEEAFFTTQKLPYGLQAKGGTFLTEFGRINPTHPHAWKWLDQPIINSRIFGPDGMRGPGARVSWLTPLPWFCQLYTGIQNANGAMVSFLSNDGNVGDRPIGGFPFPSRERPVQTLRDVAYTARLENSWDLSKTVTTKLGGSGVYGPNYTGLHADTWVYGADLVVKWRPEKNYQGWPFLLWESEIIGRTFRSLPQDMAAVPGNIIRDVGFYSQLLWGFKPGWAVGVRGEYVGGTGKGVAFDPDLGTAVFVSRNRDPFRDDRFRIAPVLSWQPSEFSRLRLQYNHDWAAHLPGKTADTIWAGVEIMYGAHPAHKY